MRSFKKVAIFLVVSLIVISICVNPSFAFDIMATINEQTGQSGDANVTGSISSIAGSIITIARVICAGVAVMMLAILGMKYMTAAPSEKADIKKHAVIYVVGAVIMFACTGILTIIQKFAAGI